MARLVFSYLFLFSCFLLNFLKADLGDDHICEMRYLESIDGLVYSAITTPGPFPGTVSDYINSQDILNAAKAGQPGMTSNNNNVLNGVKYQLRLNFYNVDSNLNATPLNNAEIYIWHCDAAGVYSAASDFSTTGQKWLRGVQQVDSKGSVTFNTIVPGWYIGRVPHIHIRVHLNSANSETYVMTTQLFVPETVIYSINKLAPYNANTQRLTDKSQDDVYTGVSADLRDKMYLVFNGDEKTGYTTTYNIGILSTGNENSTKNGKSGSGPRPSSNDSVYRKLHLLCLLAFILLF
jgi:protocatechuate 3,4-dioxygenase beta subunit